MRLDAIFKYHFTFEYWIPTAVPNGQFEYVMKDERTGMLIPGGATNSMLVTKDPMDTGMQVRNVRDRSGNVVFRGDGDSFPMYVVTADPQLDPFSNVIAYRHRLNKDLPRDYSAFIQSVVNA